MDILIRQDIPRFGGAPLFGQRTPKGAADIQVRLQSRQQNSIDAREALNQQRQRGNLSAWQWRQGTRWLTQLQQALQEQNVRQFNKAKARFLSLFQPSSTLLVQMPETALSGWNTANADRLDLHGIRLQSDTGLSIRPVNTRLHAARLSSPAVVKLPDAAQQRQADALLLAMSAQLDLEQTSAFNHSKQTLQKLFQQAGVLRTAQPLPLHLKDASQLSNKVLQGLDLSELELMPPVGERLTLENTTLLHCNLQNTILHRATFRNSLLLGGNLTGTTLENAEFQNSTLLLNRVNRASLQQASFEQSDLLLNDIAASQLADVRLSRSQLALNRLRRCPSVNLKLDDGLIRFNQLQQTHLTTEGRNVQASPQRLFEPLSNVWLDLNKRFHQRPVWPGTESELLEYLYIHSSSQAMLLPSKWQQWEPLRKLTKRLAPTPDLPNLVHQYYPYAQLSGLIPTWLRLLEDLPAFEPEQTPLDDPGFIEGLMSKLRRSPR